MICLSKIRMSMHFPCPAWTYGWQCLTVWFCSKVVSGLFWLSYDGREAWRAGTRVQDGKQRFVQSRVPQNQCFIMFHHVLSGLGLIRFHHDFHDSTCSFCVSLFVKLYELSAPFLDNPTGFWPITFGTHFLSTHEMTTRTAFLKITGRSLHEMAVTIF